MTKVILRPIITSDTQWAGVHKYKDWNYTDLGPYWTRSGRVYTGLSEKDAERLGKKLGRDLSPNSDFWDGNQFYVRTTGRDLILDLEDPLDELKYLFLKNHKRVKDSIFKHKASADFVLINQEEESRKTNVFNRLKREAIREFDKMTPDEMRKALRIFGKSAENLSPEVVENRLFEIVEGDPEGFVNKWVNNENKETQYLIERAISMNIIRKNKRQYTYGTDTIGFGLEDSIAYLNDPKNQDVRFAIQAGIEGKTPMDKPTPKIEHESLKEQPKTQLSLRPVEEVKKELRKDSSKKDKR